MEFLQDCTAMLLYLLVFWGKDGFNYLKNLINRLFSINLEVKENKSDGYSNQAIFISVQKQLHEHVTFWTFPLES